MPEQFSTDAAVDGPVLAQRAEALQGAPFVYVALTPDRRITDWNESAERLFGHSRSEAVGRDIAELVPPNGGGELWQGLLAGGDVPRVVEVLRKDGRAVRCAWSIQKIADERGAPACVRCFAHEAMGRGAPFDRQEQVEAALLRAIVESIDIAVWAVDLHGNYTYADGRVGAGDSTLAATFLGKNVFDLYAQSPDIPTIKAALQGSMGHAIAEIDAHVFESWYVPMRDGAGEVTSMAGITFDITEKRRAESELLAKLAVIEQQQVVIRELSTPIIEVWDRVLTLPMIGVIDSSRTAEVMDNLLESVVRTQARFAILDLTGVEAVDTKTAGYLIEIIRAVRLLGAEGIITGIRPSVAQTVVTLGLDLAAVTTLSNLRAGLKYCMSRMYKEQLAAQPAPAAK